MRALLAVLLAFVTGAALVACSASPEPETYGAQSAKIGESLAVLGWNVSVSNLRFDGDYVLVDVDASVAQAGTGGPVPTHFGLASTARSPIRSRATRWAVAQE